MNNLTPQQKIEIFKHLFRGREDVFAVHWEKADKSKSGYAPVCLNEWKTGICLKLQRGSNGNNIIYDYRDFNIDYLEKFFKKRNNYYKKNFDLEC